MGWIYLSLVVVGFTAMNFVMKLGSLKGHSSPALTASLFTAAALFCLAVLVISGEPITSSSPVILLAIGGGIGGAIAYFFFLSALKIGPYALTISTYTMAFLIPVAFSMAVWARPLNAAAGAGIALIVAGVALISSSAGGGKSEAKAVWARWLILLGTAFVLTGIPQIAQAAAARLGAINLWYFLFLTFLSGSIALWAFLLAKRTAPGRGVLLYGGLAGLASVAGNMFTLKALSRLPEPVVFPVSLAGPVIGAVLLSVLFFREKTKPLGYFGILLGLAGIVLLALS
jgi:drug/metabolite transporter (DMT)-like permease